MKLGEDTSLRRFASRVNKNGPIHPTLGTRCHLWTGAKDGDGYGVFWAQGKNASAHRFAFFLKHGRWPTPCCLHKCDVRACVNDDHLFEGTNADNIADMESKGRGFRVSGDEHWSRKHPEKVARGDRNGARTHPERVSKGDRHYRRLARLERQRLQLGDR